ncbi:MAG: hypothetical protein HKN39_00940 [Flavobacteriales bacterium]|nr:hypothetical protein [Flavobacteriales bacterium]
MKRLPYIFVLLMFFGLNNCGSEKAYEYDNELALFNAKHFNGFRIGDQKETVITLAKDSIEHKESELVLSKILDGEKIKYRKVNVNFDEGMVFELTVDVYLQHDSMVTSYFLKCKEKLEEIYGPSKVDNGYAAWQSPSVNNKVIEIELFDESIDHDIAMVSVNFFEDHDKSFYAE